MNANTSHEKKTTKPSSKKISVGIVVVLVFMLLEFLTLAQLLIHGYALPIGPIIFAGVAVRIYLLVSVIVLMSAFLGIIKRKKWARILGMSWYIYTSLLAVLNYIVFRVSSESLFIIYQQFKPEDVPMISEKLISNLLLATMIFALVSGGIIVLYLYRNKKYFS